MKHSDVTISILTHSNYPGCKTAISRVLDTREGAKLILTANGNAEVHEYFEKLSQQREGITVVNNIQNLGFIGPNNEAFKRCDTDYFVMLNDDAVPDVMWLDEMKEALKPEKAAISGRHARFLDNDFIGRVGPMDDFIEGSCMMVKTDLVRPHGLFSDYLFYAYCEDADLCLRMRKLGYSIHKVLFALDHKPGTTTRTVPFLHDTMKKNFETCKRKWQHYLDTRRFD